MCRPVGWWTGRRPTCGPVPWELDWLKICDVVCLAMVYCVIRYDFKSWRINNMAEQENSKDLISVLWSGADILRSKMDANEYKNYLLGIVFYKYLSDSFLIKVYDMICDDKPESLKEALDVYFEKEEEIDLNELLSEMKKTDEELQQTQTEFRSLLKELTSSDEKIMSSLNNLIEKMEGR
nr:type I restriction-modification system subunit M N-terminal domain-containing protein [uncultured Blautia sp.]